MLATAADVRSSIRNGASLPAATVDDLLAAADAAAKTFLSRNLESGTYTERVRAKVGGEWMRLNEWPVTAVNQVNVAKSEAMSVWNAGAARAQITISSTAITLKEFVSGAWSTEVLPFADYPTLSQMEAAIVALARWDATLSGEVTGAEPSSDLASLNGPIDVANSKILKLFLLDGVPATDWDMDDGTFKFTECGIREGESVLVQYVGGESTIPADVSKAVGMIAAEMYQNDTASVGAGMRREKLGDYEGERFQDNSAKVITPTVAKLLNPYRRVD